MTITIDRAGRVVLPKAVRDRYHLVPGSELEITPEADGLKLAVRSSQPALVHHDGVLIHHGPGPVDTDIVAFLRQSRENRSLSATVG